MSDAFDPAAYRQIIRSHSRSFSLAARLLPRSIRTDVEKLYAWCRQCDDAVDRAASSAQAESSIQQLREDVERIYAGEVTKHPASKWLAELVDKYAIPKQYPLELLDGMETDLGQVCMGDQEQLLRYCHRAAGTVGLMLCSLFGVSNPRALHCADSLGIAMQLTNIARDVREDWQVGRCYLPKAWISQLPEQGHPLTNEVVREPIRRILDLADKYYRVGLSGLRYLPGHCQFSIRVAARLYREIGEVLREKDFRAIDGRVHVPVHRKIGLITKELATGRRVQPLRQSATYAKPNSIPNPLLPILGEVMKKEARYIATLGISLSAILAAALFVMVAFNPKDAVTYSYLPWIYAVGCAIAALISQWLLRRMEKDNQPLPVRIEIDHYHRSSDRRI